MGLRINTNIQSIAAQRSLSSNRETQNKSLERVSSGARINRASDDAAGLAISEKLRSNIRSIKQATKNANDGISLIQVAEGALNEIGNIMTRLRELSIQAASDTVGDVERGFIHKEITNLKSEIDRIANSTEYNGSKLLNGSLQDLEFQVGIHNNPNEDRLVFGSGTLATNLETLNLTSLSTETRTQSQDNLELIDQAINKLNDNRSTLGALQNRINSTINNLGIYRENIEAAFSRIRDTDMAEEISEMTRNNILTQANISVLGQANANAQLALKLLA